MNISLPGELKEFVDDQVATRGFSTSSEYVRDLIRREKERLGLRELLLDGAKSPVAGPADAAYFARLREKARRPARR